MTKPAYIVTSNAITVIWEGKPYTLNTDNPNYTGLKNALINAEYDTIPEGIPVKPEYVICSDPDTNAGLFATLLYST